MIVKHFKYTSLFYGEISVFLSAFHGEEIWMRLLNSKSPEGERSKFKVLVMLIIAHICS